MGPERKQKRLDEARGQSVEVAVSYEIVKDASAAYAEILAKKDSVAKWERTSFYQDHRTAGWQLAEAEFKLKQALRKHGFNAFDARDLSAFAAKRNPVISR